MDVRSRARAAIAFGALGDSLGFPVEFLKWEDIQEKYGPEGIMEPELQDGYALISDDTQMTLFTACGLAKGGIPDVWEAYLDWLDTQTGGHAGRHKTPLYCVKRLHARRAPGHTCMSVLRGRRPGHPEESVNGSKGCGGVMRAAPAGIWAGSMDEAVWTGCRVAALTHGGSMGFLPAGFLAGLVYQGIHGASMETGISLTRDAMLRLPLENGLIPVLDRWVEKAAETAGEPCSDREAVTSLGEGWLGHEALCIGLCAAIRHPDSLEACLRMAVNHGGDSDSTGAIAGNLFGAFHGMDDIRWQGRTELWDLCLLMADACLDRQLPGIEKFAGFADGLQEESAHGSVN